MNLNSGLLIISGLLALTFIAGFTITMNFGTGLTGTVNSTFISGNRGWISTIPDSCLFEVGVEETNVTLINIYLLNNYPLGSEVYYSDYCKDLISGTQRYKYIVIGVSLLSPSVLLLIMIVMYLLVRRRTHHKQESTYFPLKDISIQPPSDPIGLPPPPYSIK